MLYYNYPLTIERINRNLDIIDKISLVPPRADYLQLLTYKRRLMHEVYSLIQALKK
jgi:hypothetical protein